VPVAEWFRVAELVGVRGFAAWQANPVGSNPADGIELRAV